MSGAEATDRAIRSVLVAGGGVVAWSAAAAFKRRMPWLDVAILPHHVSADALADTTESTLPSILGFHADLGLSDEDAIGRTGSSFRLGTLFRGWAPEPDAYLHAYGEHGRPIAATSFHLHWRRLAAQQLAAPFDDYSPSVAVARSGRIDAVAGDEAFVDVESGLQLDLDRYCVMLRALSQHCGVRAIRARLAGVNRRADGFIATLALDDGTAAHADLFVDATGPAALLRRSRDDTWADWSGHLLCDRIIRAEAPPSPDRPLYDTVTAMEAGWSWRTATSARTIHGYCYSSRFCDDAAAAECLRVVAGVEPERTAVTIGAGTQPLPWQRNCVAIGDAATVIEPLEWSNLHLAHSAIDRIIGMMPGAGCAPVELAEYNRQTYAEAIRVRDFVLLHHVTARRDEPFWRAAAAVPQPPTLAHTLDLFRERGRLPVHEEETFARDSWLSVLFGQGVLPRRVDPLAETLPVAAAARALEDIRLAVAAAVSNATVPAGGRPAQARQSA